LSVVSNRIAENCPSRYPTTHSLKTTALTSLLQLPTQYNQVCRFV